MGFHVESYEVGKTSYDSDKEVWACPFKIGFVADGKDATYQKILHLGHPAKGYLGAEQFPPYLNFWKRALMAVFLPKKFKQYLNVRRYQAVLFRRHLCLFYGEASALEIDKLTFTLKNGETVQTAPAPPRR